MYSSNRCEVALTGSAFEFILSRRNLGLNIGKYSSLEVLNEVLKKAKVYSRMTPTHKANLVKELQRSTGQLIGMWGDDNNDWEALKICDVGISLSNGPTSITTSFVSLNDNLSSIWSVLRLSRSFLDLSFELFKLAIVYLSIRLITFGILYQSEFDVDDNEILYSDIGWIFMIALMLCFAKPNEKLAGSYPDSTLLNSSIILSIVGQIFIQVCCLIGVFTLLKGQQFYLENHTADQDHIHDYETTTIFLFSLPQYLFVSIAFHISSELRSSFLHNIPFVVVIVMWLSIIYWLILFPMPWMMTCLDLGDLNLTVKLLLSWWTLFNGFISIGFELWFKQFLIENATYLKKSVLSMLKY